MSFRFSRCHCLCLLLIIVMIIIFTGRPFLFDAYLDVLSSELLFCFDVIANEPKFYQQIISISSVFFFFMSHWNRDNFPFASSVEYHLACILKRMLQFSAINQIKYFRFEFRCVMRLLAKQFSISIYRIYFRLMTDCYDCVCSMDF